MEIQNTEKAELQENKRETAEKINKQKSKKDGQSEALNRQIAELTDTLKRLQADFENYKKRVEKEKADFQRYAQAKLITNFLPLLDSFELALKNNNGSDHEKFAKGIELIYAQFYSMLESQGLKPIEASGRIFDPYKHEALMQAESSQDDIILEELQRGYMLNDIIIRTSKVKVGKKRGD